VDKEGKRRERATNWTRVAERAAKRDHGLDRADRLAQVVGEEAFPRAPLEQLRPGLRRQRIREAKSARVLRRRLAMRAHRGGLLGRRRREAEDGVGVAGAVRVVCEACCVRQPRRGRGKAREGRAVEAQPTPGLDRFFDRQASELMAERHGAGSSIDQHPGAQTFLQRDHVLAGQRLEQPQLDL
jgi:hypothetical protein